MTKAELIESDRREDSICRRARRSVSCSTIFDDIVAALRKAATRSTSPDSGRSRSRIARRGPVAIPKTGESIQISASRSAKFKPGKTLKDSLN